MRSTQNSESAPTALVRDDRGVLSPRLRMAQVVGRACGYGVIASVLLFLGMQLQADHEQRLTVLSVTSLLSFVSAAIGLVFGPFYWLCARGDIKRWRDWRAARGRFDGVSVFAPTLLRCGIIGLVLGPSALLLGSLVEHANQGGWLYGNFSY